MTRRKSNIAKSLLPLAMLFYLGSVASIVLLMVAGSTVQGGQHPGFYSLPTLGLELVSFHGPIRQTKSSLENKALDRDYWFLNSFGWHMVWDEESYAAGYVYHQPGREIRFPEIFHELNTTLFEKGGPGGGGYVECGTTCDLGIPKDFFSRFKGETFFAKTAPVFAFFVVTGALILLMFAYKIYEHKASKAKRSGSYLYGLILGTNIVAASIMTHIATGTTSFLNRTNIPFSAQVGTGALICAWVGCGATLLGGLTMIFRDQSFTHYVPLNKVIGSHEDGEMLVERNQRTQQSYDSAP